MDTYNKWKSKGEKDERKEEDPLLVGDSYERKKVGERRLEGKVSYIRYR